MTDYSGAIATAEQQNGIPAGLLDQLLTTESSQNPTAYNPVSGAIGIAQIEPGTAADPGYGINPVNPSDPFASIAFAGQYLKAMFTKTGSWAGAVQAYGTVGSQGPVNQNQQNLWTMANAADNSGSGITGANLNNASYGGNIIPVVGAPGGGSGAGTGGTTAPGAPLTPGAGFWATLGLQPDITSWLGSLPGEIGNAFKQAVSGFLSSIENWVTRGFLIVVGIVLAGIALWRLLAPNVSPKDVVAAVAA